LRSDLHLTNHRLNGRDLSARGLWVRGTLGRILCRVNPTNRIVTQPHGHFCPSLIEQRDRLIGVALRLCHVDLGAVLGWSQRDLDIFRQETNVVERAIRKGAGGGGSSIEAQQDYRRGGGSHLGKRLRELPTALGRGHQPQMTAPHRHRLREHKVQPMLA
jgi:hypothetical protein